MKRRTLIVLPFVLAAGIGTGLALASIERATSTVVVKATMNAALGKKVLVNSAGLTLYRNKTETAGRVKCIGACASLWPPLMLPRGVTRATAGAGVVQSALGKAKRPGGKWQVTYKGQRLYRFATDRRPGQAQGEGIGGIWFAVSTGAASTSTGTSTSTTTSAPPPPPSTTTASTPYPYPTYP
jgi:predicted lipoprotein with Yx(FWY)xxD motif